MRIVLYCQYGMSTSVLVSKMNEAKDPADIIEAYPIEDAEITLDKFDVALLGPQIRGKYDEVKVMADAKNVPCLLMDMRSYGRMDGEGIYLQAKRAYEEKCKNG